MCNSLVLSRFLGHRQKSARYPIAARTRHLDLVKLHFRFRRENLLQFGRHRQCFKLFAASLPEPIKIFRLRLRLLEIEHIRRRTTIEKHIAAGTLDSPPFAVRHPTGFHQKPDKPGPCQSRFDRQRALPVPKPRLFHAVVTRPAPGRHNSLGERRRPMKRHLEYDLLANAIRQRIFVGATL